jgi:hypothetical protein
MVTWATRMLWALNDLYFFSFFCIFLFVCIYMQDPIKDHEKRSYTMNYENVITTISTSAWSAN